MIGAFYGTPTRLDDKEIFIEMVNKVKQAQNGTHIIYFLLPVPETYHITINATIVNNNKNKSICFIVKKNRISST